MNRNVIALAAIAAFGLTFANAATAEDFSLTLGPNVWASGQAANLGSDSTASPLARPEVDLSIGFELSDLTALTFGWRELSVDPNEPGFLEDMDLTNPFIGFAFRF